MAKIKAYTEYDGRTNSYYYDYFEIVDKLPQIGDITLNGDIVEEITGIAEYRIENYGITEEHYKYNYYIVDILYQPVDESEEPTEGYYKIAVPRDNEEE